MQMGWARGRLRLETATRVNGKTAQCMEKAVSERCSIRGLMVIFLGTYTYSNGDTLTAVWRRDAVDGRGLYKFADGVIYDGELNASGQPHGYGVLH